jgi:hypothetical protein
MVYVFPDAHESSMDLYEDDGISLEHRKGKFAITRISAKRGTSGVSIGVGETEGSFEGQVQDRTWSFTVAVDFVPRSVEAHDKALPGTMWRFDKERNEVKIQPLPGPVDIVIA